MSDHRSSLWASFHLDKIFRTVQQEENHKKVMNGLDHKHDNAVAFGVSHLIKEGEDGRHKVSYKHCGKSGHEVSNYFKLVGYSAGWSLRGRCGS